MSACSSLTPDCSEKPSAMALDESGTEKTQSVPGAGCSRASSRPSARCTPSTERWNTVLSGREKYTSSNTQRRCGRRGKRGSAAPSPPGMRTKAPRSEEHTSEIQSPCKLVCRLLLGKKKKKNQHDLALSLSAPLHQL